MHDATCACRRCRFQEALLQAEHKFADKAPEPVCGSCRFFQLTNKYEAEGVCRRRSPVLVPRQNNGGMATTEFPGVLADVGWCGDYEEKPCPR